MPHTASEPIAPFAAFFSSSGSARSPLRKAITDACRMPETQAVRHVVEHARLDPAMREAIQRTATSLTQRLRSRAADSGRSGLVQGLLQEYSLSSEEGVALMCLAEALLRIPDAATRDALIRDKVREADWRAHLGQSESFFVNAATWGLVVTGKLVGAPSEGGFSAVLARLVRTGGEPLIRKAVDAAMRVMGEQFVTGETIQSALRNAAKREARGFCYSFDMLGEAASTAADAARYLREYQDAIHAIGRAAVGQGLYDGPGISIKLSALHPRYTRAQRERVMTELYPRVLGLCELAKGYGIGLNIDAEESERLELSLDVLEDLAHEPLLAGWNGLGFVIQAYQKRCPFVVDFVIDLARRSARRLMVRLVKGAYWDSEIKRAQIDGLEDYPVYTRKPFTDASYIACARKLLAAPEAVYPQFATHNAHTVATIYHLAGPTSYRPGQFEFQCLHGMGEPLYDSIVGPESEDRLGRPCRIYAPVGTHETLLAYLVRRLLENGANTSFVNRVADRGVRIEDLIRDPIDEICALARAEATLGRPHPAIPLPRHLFGDVRSNSSGLDLASETVLQRLGEQMERQARTDASAGPLLARGAAPGATRPVTHPACHALRVGWVQSASADDVDAALADALDIAPRWAAVPPSQRAAALDAAAGLLEQALPELMTLLIAEAGKTAANAVAEVREAADFLRFYAAQIRTGFDNQTHVPLGPVVCISPWNFPLAIFMGQVAAALAAGNVVLAKPADQTPLVAARAVHFLWQAGIPRAAVQLLTGRGSVVGAQLIADARVQGVMFTGSTEVARELQKTIAGRVTADGRPIPLIAETGGQNAMIVDSSALAEQVVADVIASAFDSAGQRCSALRVLCVQEEIAEKILQMLLGAMAQLQIGRPDRLATDVGPVIDARAQAAIEAHIEAMRGAGRRVHQAAMPAEDDLAQGTFVLPTLIEIDSIAELRHEVFGPVLHFVRFARKDLAQTVQAVNATGYALTMGVHTRIDDVIDRVTELSLAGNLYVNRNMVGAVVGVQPFGGEGLSGTGPKAGGPLYLYRLLARRPHDVLLRALPDAAAAAGRPTAAAHRLVRHLAQWAARRYGMDAEIFDRLEALGAHGGRRLLAGPTGEENAYRLEPRKRVLCLAGRDEDRVVQLAAVLAVGGRALWTREACALHSSLPDSIRERVALGDGDWATEAFDAVILHGSLEELVELQGAIARREGPVVTVDRLAPGSRDIQFDRLVIERAVSTNTAAAGGNASLMTLA